jgi:ribosomal RNA-processing protein 8
LTRLGAFFWSTSYQRVPMAKKRTRTKSVRKEVSKSPTLESGKERKRLKNAHEDRETGVSNDEKSLAEAPSPKTVDSTSNGEKWSKSKRKRMRKVMTKLRMGQGSAEKDHSSEAGKSDSSTLRMSGTTTEKSSSDAVVQTNDDDDNNNKKRGKSSVGDAFKARLAGSRFRVLNEELYTTTSQESFDRFTKNPELFEQYHVGFRHQVSSWPENPIDAIVRSLTSTYAAAHRRGNKASPIVVADFGCGDAQLARDLSKVRYGSGGKRNEEGDGVTGAVFSVHSFDLVAANEAITACDMANVPLEDGSVDVCVFCLSLMGTNLADFLREAHRVLRDDGRVTIAEVRSRIEYSHHHSGNDRKTPDGEGGTLHDFLDVLSQLGFDCIRSDKRNTMFLMLELAKNGKKPNRKLQFSAKPCIYKRR